MCSLKLKQLKKRNKEIKKENPEIGSPQNITTWNQAISEKGGTKGTVYKS